MRRAVARSGRRATAGVMLLVYALAMSGVPVPERRLGAVLSEPFPCQDGACGCRTAERCWRSCCCYSDAQKLAWAEAHRVRPPAEFLERVAKQGTSAARVAAAPRRCCTASAERSRGAASPGGAATCGGGVEAACEVEQPSAAEERSGDPARLVIAIEAFKCRGLGTDWTGVGDFVPPSAPPAGQPAEPPADARPELAAVLPALSFPPPSPPPRPAPTQPTV